ncbi:SiaC family regulatory phosphoprotein [Microscilla marina]|uniref:SiaC family regulatory phosphoprotein domain-containing protein n=1 Tax=Microscilla marina ATCC 23134 TaxID=313606 RepID=A1ZTD3_MICM2|nr:SiaC family regulatory phosphoprotein [Microscilla marina]EAY26355.1 hypothetical protein M23134_04633 [Microscilla marina ATCC 23134]
MGTHLTEQIVIDWVKQILDYINNKFPLAHLRVDKNCILETNDVWLVRCQNNEYLSTGDVRYQLHAFPEPFILIDKRDYQIYLVRDAYCEELPEAYKSFRGGGFYDVIFEEVLYKNITASQSLIEISSPDLLEEVSSIWQGSTHLRSINELCYSNFSNLSKEDVLALAEAVARQEGLNKSNETVELVVSNLSSVDSVWFVGFQSQAFLLSNKVQDMLLGNPVYLVDKQDGKIYACEGSGEGLLNDFLYHKYGWHSEFLWEPLNLPKIRLELPKTKETPYICFNADKGIFKIEGKSTIREDELFFAFYRPVVDFLEGYKQIALPKSVFYFDIEYLDERSNGFYFDIFGKISELQEFTKVYVIWYFEDDDQGDIGAEYLEHFSDLSMEFVQKTK